MTTLNIEEFRGAFPVYADAVKYPDEMLNAKYEVGKCYISDNDCTLPEACRAYALQLMLAHLLYIQDQVMSGLTGRQVSSASEGPVSVSFVDPPNQSTFTYWMNTSPYGMQITTMLEKEAAGGFYIGGSPELSGFRNGDGSF